MSEIAQGFVEDLEHLLEDYDPSEPLPEGLQKYSTGLRDHPEFAEAYAKILDSLKRIETIEHLKPEDRPTLERAVAKLAEVDRYLHARPFILVKALAKFLGSTDLDITSEMIRQANEAALAASLYERGEHEHLLTLVTTPDPLGILLRGFVLIDGALDECFERILVKPINLYTDLDLYFIGKALLGNALGFISDEEYSFFKALNKVRNSLVHHKRTRQQEPRYVFTPEEEQRLWSQFLTVPTLRGDWPQYDADAFPLHLKIMVVRCHLLLFNRSTRLSERRIDPLTGYHLQPTLERIVGTGIALFMVRTYPRMISDTKRQE